MSDEITKCPNNPHKPGEHCMHESRGSHGSGESFYAWSGEQCCWCGHRVVKAEQTTYPTHGQMAPQRLDRMFPYLPGKRA